MPIRPGLALVAELAHVLARHHDLRCTPTLVDDDAERGAITLSVTFHADSIDDGLDLLALCDDLRYVVDVAQLRAFAHCYGIDPAALEALLPDRAPAARSARRPEQLTLDELTGLIDALEGRGPVNDWVETVLPKLRAQLAGEIF